MTDKNTQMLKQAIRDYLQWMRSMETRDIPSGRDGSHQGLSEGKPLFPVRSRLEHLV